MDHLALHLRRQYLRRVARSYSDMVESQNATRHMPGLHDLHHMPDAPMRNLNHATPAPRDHLGHSCSTQKLRQIWHIFLALAGGLLPVPHAAQRPFKHRLQEGAELMCGCLWCARRSCPSAKTIQTVCVKLWSLR